jgi:hypothetical protein
MLSSLRSHIPKTKSYLSFKSSSLLPNCHHQRQLLPLTLNKTNVNVTVRNMSSAATPTKKEFLCILPDFPGAQAKRLEVRP